MVAFYTQGDQDIYEEGEHFIPQEYYRLNKFNNTVAPVPPEAPQSFGITNTNAFTGGGGGGGDGVTFSNTNKFGLDMDTLKTINQGKWTGSEYEKTRRQIAQDAQGNWKDINTNQNVYHGGFNVKTPMTMLLGKFTGKKTTDDPYKGSWYGHEEWNDEDMNIGTRRTVPQNMIQRWKENREIKKEKIKADDIAAHNLAGAEEIGATGPQWHTSKGGQDRPGEGGQNVKSSSGDTYGGEALGYNEAAEKSDYYAQGGRARFFYGGLVGIL